MALGAMQRALVNAGLIEEPRTHRKRPQKEIKCFKCGESMIRIENTNVIACSNNKCSNYRVFSSNK